MSQERTPSPHYAAWGQGQFTISFRKFQPVIFSVKQPIIYTPFITPLTVDSLSGSRDETEFDDETDKLARSNIPIDISVVTSFETPLCASPNTTLDTPERSDCHTKSHIESAATQEILTRADDRDLITETRYVNFALF
jgi:hypothetical protein